MIDTAVYTAHNDPGHGWLEVPASLVTALDVHPSEYSYRSRDGGTLYLEEDCDAPTFIRAYEVKYGTVHVVDMYHNRDCFVRSLPRVTQ